MNIRILAVPFDSSLRGVRMGAGPARLLDGGLVDHLRARGHGVEVEWVEPEGEVRAEIRTAFDLARSLARAVRSARDAGAFSLVLAGNCNTAVGTLAGMGREPVSVVWLDAHGDLHTPDTTTSGFLDGMALAVVTGRCWTRLADTVPGFRPVPDDRVLLLGTRDLDPAEAESLAGARIGVLPPDVLPGGLEAALEVLAVQAPAAYVHLDLDVLDPQEARANGFAAPGGLSLAAATQALAAVRRHLRVGAAALTAYDPECDPEGRVCRAAAAMVGALLEEQDVPLSAPRVGTNLAAGETSSTPPR